MGPFSVMIARFPGNQQEHPDSSGYVINLAFTLPNDSRISKVVPFKLSDTPITMSRNRCVKNALDRGIDYLLMLDSDMSPDTEMGAQSFWDVAWNFMMDRRTREANEIEAAKVGDSGGVFLEHAQSLFPPATIAAPYCGPPPHECVYVFRWAGKASGDADQSFKLEMFDRDDAARKSGIEEVAALPTGLILYDMRVFRKLPAPWFRYEWTDGYETEKASTEDVYQTRNASLMGMPQYCAWDCWAGHVKTKIVCKPRPLTCQSMRKEFRDAVLRHDRKEAEAKKRDPLPDLGDGWFDVKPAEDSERGLAMDLRRIVYGGQGGEQGVRH
jgi:hypothetical protein